MKSQIDKSEIAKGMLKSISFKKDRNNPIITQTYLELDFHNLTLKYKTEKTIKETYFKNQFGYKQILKFTSNLDEIENKNLVNNNIFYFKMIFEKKSKIFISETVESYIYWINNFKNFFLKKEVFLKNIQHKIINNYRNSNIENEIFKLDKAFLFKDQNNNNYLNTEEAGNEEKKKLTNSNITIIEQTEDHLTVNISKNNYYHPHAKRVVSNGNKATDSKIFSNEEIFISKIKLQNLMFDYFYIIVMKSIRKKFMPYLNDELRVLKKNIKEVKTIETMVELKKEMEIEWEGFDKPLNNLVISNTLNNTQNKVQDEHDKILNKSHSNNSSDKNNNKETTINLEIKSNHKENNNNNDILHPNKNRIFDDELSEIIISNNSYLVKNKDFSNCNIKNANAILNKLENKKIEKTDKSKILDENDVQFEDFDFSINSKIINNNKNKTKGFDNNISQKRNSNVSTDEIKKFDKDEKHNNSGCKIININVHTTDNYEKKGNKIYNEIYLDEKRLIIYEDPDRYFIYKNKITEIKNQKELEKENESNINNIKNYINNRNNREENESFYNLNHIKKQDYKNDDYYESNNNFKNNPKLVKEYEEEDIVDAFIKNLDLNQDELIIDCNSKIYDKKTNNEENVKYFIKTNKDNKNIISDAKSNNDSNINFNSINNNEMDEDFSKPIIQVVKDKIKLKNGKTQEKYQNIKLVDFNFEVIDYDFGQEMEKNTSKTDIDKKLIGIDSPHFTDISIMAQRFNKVDNIDEWKDYIK